MFVINFICKSNKIMQLFSPKLTAYKMKSTSEQI